MYRENQLPEGVIPGTPAEATPLSMGGLGTEQSEETIFKQRVGTTPPIAIEVRPDAQPRG